MFKKHNDDEKWLDLLPAPKHAGSLPKDEQVYTKDDVSKILTLVELRICKYV